jgi:hypothetical protein
MARKWLSLKLAPPSLGVASRMVYAGGNDYGLMAHRLGTDNVAAPLSSEEMAAFVEMTAEGYRNAAPPTDADAPAAFLAFRDAVFPLPVEQEQWQPYARKDHFRERAYFLAAQLPAVYGEMVSAIHGWGLSDEQRRQREHLDEAADIHQRINAYHAANKGVAVAATNQLLRELDLSHMDSEEPVDNVGEMQIEQETQGGPECAAALEAYQQRDKVRVVFAPGDADQATLVRTPAMRAYAQAALVNATFCNVRLAKQMLLHQLGQPLEGTGLMGRNQRLPSAEMEVPALEPEALNALAAPLGDLPLLNKESEAVQALYAACQEQPVTVATFLRTALDVYGKVEGEVPLWKRDLLKQWPNIDASIVKCLLAL